MRALRLSPSMSRRVRALLACGIVLGTATLGTTALWSTSAATVSGTFTTADLQIRANGVTKFDFAFDGELFPGDSTASEVNVQNVGSTDFTYTASVSGTEGLARTVRLKVVAGVTPADGKCPGTATENVDNRPITGFSIPFLTDRGQLARETGVDSLCLQLTLPTDAPNLAGQDGRVTFTFDATAVAP